MRHTRWKTGIMQIVYSLSEIKTVKKKVFVSAGGIGLLGIVWIIYCSAGVLDKDSYTAALKIAKSYGGFEESELSVSDAPSVFTVEKSLPMSLLAKQKMITFDVNRAGISGKLYIHLYKWAGFGWKLLQYKNATDKTNSNKLDAGDGK